MFIIFRKFSYRYISLIGLFLNKLLPLYISLQSYYPTFEMGIPKK